jgi:Spy/CpxP family protein refolding chaperone
MTAIMSRAAAVVQHARESEDLAMSKLIMIAFLLLPAFASAQDAHSGHHFVYAGEEVRDVKSLSPADVAELRNGEGWGLAKPAELNGVPGPRHVLDLAGQLALTQAQIGQVKQLFDDMKAQAVAEGTLYLEAERKVDAVFRQPGALPGQIADALALAESSRSRLRYIHLAAHLETARILSAGQIREYGRLRGYRQAGTGK